MTLDRNLSRVVLEIALSKKAHADGATITRKGAGSAAERKGVALHRCFWLRCTKIVSAAIVM